MLRIHHAITIINCDPWLLNYTILETLDFFISGIWENPKISSQFRFEIQKLINLKKSIFLLNFLWNFVFLHIHYFFVFHSFMSNLIFLQFLNFHLEMTFSQIDLPYLTLVIFKLSQHCLQSCECCSMRFPKSKSTSWVQQNFS